VRAPTRLFTSILLAVLLAVLLAGCGGDDAKTPGDQPVTGVTEVSMKNLQFKPKVIKVPVGTKVTWKFDDGSVPHNVVGPGFKSKTTDKGTFDHTFNAAGTVDYRCELHTNMTGKVIVG
jgi:plastocyanin